MMLDAQHPLAIFLPMLVIVALTFIAFFKMAVARGAAVKGGHDPAYYRAHIGDPEPEATRAAVRHWDNLFEMPTVFYAACITAFVVGAVTGWMLIFAWAFAIGRLVQSLVHMSYNDPAHRGIAFSLSALALLAMWIDLALIIIGKL